MELTSHGCLPKLHRATERCRLPGQTPVFMGRHRRALPAVTAVPTPRRRAGPLRATNEGRRKPPESYMDDFDIPGAFVLTTF